jgi:hypothetical protein
MSKNPLVRYGAAGVAAVVLALAGYAAVNAGSDPAVGSAAAANRNGFAPNGPQGQMQAPSSSYGQGAQGGPGAQGGQGRPQLGTPATGADATKAKAAATAKYPGSVEAVMKLDDGSYVVHVVTSSGEQHVLVSASFRVTGVQQGPPHGFRGGAPGNGTPPSGPGAAPPAGAGSGATPPSDNGSGVAPPSGSVAPSTGSSSTGSTT